MYSVRTILSIALLMFSSLLLNAQLSIKGRVLDFATKEPLVAASVYLNNTTQGVFTDEQGQFTLPYNPNYNEVVVSYVGYETISYLADSTDTSKSLKFLSRPLPEIIQEVSITSTRSKAWKNNYYRFKERIIGTSRNASDTQILNPEAIYFEKDQSTGTLKAFAREPIIIENKALGYKLEYALVEFSYNQKTFELLYAGNPKFTQLEGSKRKVKKWNRSRDRAYKGSFQHFANSIKAGTYRQEGFQVNRIKRVPNPDRPPQRVLDSLRQVLRTTRYTEGTTVINLAGSKNDLRSLERLPKYIEYLDEKPLDPTEFIDITEDAMTLSFPDYWQVLYKKESMDPMYRFPGELSAPSPQTPQTSVFHILGEKADFNKIGILFDPLVVRFEGYWAFEKLPYLLPLDYQIEE